LIHKKIAGEQHFLISAFLKTLTCLKFTFKSNEIQENLFLRRLTTYSASNTKLYFDVKRSSVTKNAFLKSAKLIVVNTFIPFYRNSVRVLIYYGSTRFMALGNKFRYSAGIVIKVIMPAEYYDRSFRSLTFSEFCFVSYLRVLSSSNILLNYVNGMDCVNIRMCLKPRTYIYFYKKRRG